MAKRTIGNELRSVRIQRERQEALEAREAREAFDFRDAVETERAKLVLDVDDNGWTGDAGVRAALKARAGDTGNALMTAVYDTLRLRGDVATKASWLKDKLADLERALTANTFYASNPVQNVDDLHMVYGQFYQALKHTRHLANALGVHVPQLCDARDLATRAKMVALTAVLESDGLWRLKSGADYAAGYSGDTLPGYDAEWKAWRAAKVLVHP